MYHDPPDALGNKIRTSKSSNWAKISAHSDFFSSASCGSYGRLKITFSPKNICAKTLKRKCTGFVRFSEVVFLKFLVYLQNSAGFFQHAPKNPSKHIPTPFQTTLPNPPQRTGVKLKNIGKSHRKNKEKPQKKTRKHKEKPRTHVLFNIHP